MEKSISEKFLNKTESHNIDDFILLDLLEEIELIKDPSICSFVRSILIKAESFWYATSSSVEGTHPPDEYEVGGLVLHTKRVVRTAMLLSNAFECSSLELDSLIAAALLHDVTKSVWRSEEKKEILHDVMHPYTVDNFVDWCMAEDSSQSESSKTNSLNIPEEIMRLILRMIRCSHGVWSPIPETVPFTTLEKTLHTADFIAANVHYIIDGNDILGERWQLKIET